MLGDSKVMLKSCDNKLFKVDRLVAFESQTLKRTIEDIEEESAIPLPNVTSEVLAMVIAYCEYHAESQKSSSEKPIVHEDDIKQWDAEFMKVDYPTLAGLIMAAKYLNIQKLVDLTSQTIVDRISAARRAGKTPLESTRLVREMLNIENDFTPEEEKKLIQEQHWSFGAPSD